MTHIVSITSQGQISIPAKIRRSLAIEKNQKAYVKEEGGKIVIEPIADILSLKGSLKHKAKRGMSIDKIIELEEKAWEEAAVERYLRTLKCSKK